MRLVFIIFIAAVLIIAIPEENSYSENNTLKNPCLHGSAWPLDDWTPWQGSSSRSVTDGIKISFGKEIQQSETPCVGMELCGTNERWGGISQGFTVKEGQTLKASGCLGSLLTDNPFSGNAEAWIEVKFISVKGNEIEKHSSEKITEAAACLKQLAISCIIPEGADKAVFSFCLFGRSKSSGTVYFSDACVETIDGEYAPRVKSLFVKEISNGPVQVLRNRILVKGKPFIIRGVCYQPIPVGYDVTEYKIYSKPDIYNRDIPILRSMGANTIRTYAKITSKEFLDACYNKGRNPIYVIMGFYIEGRQGLGDSAVRDKIKSDFRLYIKEYKDHPAVLMWSPGNETECAYEGSDRDYYTLLNELAQTAYEEEGDDYHPVTASVANTFHIGDPGLFTTDEDMVYLDVWGANVYQGISFGNLFEDYKRRSGKPLWISEFGVDSWYSVDKQNPSYGYVNERLQAILEGALWDEIMSNSDVCSGGAVFEYSDEWWKARYGNKAEHDYGGYEIEEKVSEHPDGYSNEEWYGFVAVSNGKSGLDVVQPRKAYYALKSRWAGEKAVIRASRELSNTDLCLANISLMWHVFGITGEDM